MYWFSSVMGTQFHGNVDTAGHRGLYCPLGFVWSQFIKRTSSPNKLRETFVYGAVAVSVPNFVRY